MSRAKPQSVKLSVVIPAFNESASLPAVLSAILHQDFQEKYEVIVVDNNSKDTTKDVAKSFGVTVITEKKQGVIQAKQAGCTKAQGKIIAILEADNIPPRHWVRTMYEAFKNPSLAAITGPYLLPTSAPTWGIYYYRFFTFLVKLSQSVTGSARHVWGGSVGFRRDYFLQSGGFDTRFRVGADEIKLRQSLQKFGKIRVDDSLGVITSPRRLLPGIMYYFFEYCLKEYLLNYASTLLFNRQLAPPRDLR